MKSPLHPGHARGQVSIAPMSAMPGSRSRLHNVTSGCRPAAGSVCDSKTPDSFPVQARGDSWGSWTLPQLQSLLSPCIPQEWLHRGGSPMGTGRAGISCTLAWWHMGRVVPWHLLRMGRMQPPNSSWKSGWGSMGRSSRSLTGQAEFPATRVSHLLSYCLPFPWASPGSCQPHCKRQLLLRSSTGYKKIGKEKPKPTRPKTNIAKDRTHQILKESNSSCQQGGHRNCSQMWQGCHLL